MLSISATSFRGLIRWQWPVVRWTMYEHKGPTEPVVSYRRFVVEDVTGRREAIDLGRAYGFLSRPYRLDKGLDKNMPGFLVACLHQLRAREGAHLIALTYEKRTWRYRERSYREHLDDAPDWSFRVAAIEAAPEAMRTAGPDISNAVSHGDFRRLGRRTGSPRGWEIDGRWYGVGIDPATDDQAFLLPASPEPQSARQTVTVPASSALVVALGLAKERGASIEVITASGTTRLEVPDDGIWHHLEARVDVGADGALSVRLANQGSDDAYFDDVAVHGSAD